MATIVKMPKMGLTMTEGQIIKWLKKEGERVEKGEPILEIQTDKVNLEEEAPVSGILRKILYGEGETVPILVPIAVIGREDEELPEIDSSSPVEEAQAPDAGQTEAKHPIQAHKPDQVNSDSPSIGKYGKIKATPAAKRIAAEKGVDLYSVIGTDEGHRITADDVQNHIESGKGMPRISPVARKMAEEEDIMLGDINLPPGQRIMKSHIMQRIQDRTGVPGPADDSILEEIPLTGMRKIIAEKMEKSMREAPHFYLTAEVDMTSLIALRENLNSDIQDRQDRISFNDMLIKVTARALQKHRIINSRIAGEKIQVLKQINIGLAVALNNGLIVPVIKDADKKSLSEIARQTRSLIDRAKHNRLMPDEFTGGTFTISNLGMYDIVEFTAIINNPESAILAVGKIQDRPVVTPERQLEIKPMMNITLSSDHRVIDGAEGAKFLKDVKAVLENPVKLLL